MDEDHIVVDIDEEEEVSSKETAKPWEKEIVWESLDQIPSGKIGNTKDLEFLKKLEKRRFVLFCFSVSSKTYYCSKTTLLIQPQGSMLLKKRVRL